MTGTVPVMTKRIDASGTHVWLVLMKAHRSMARHAAQSTSEHELALTDFVILEALLHKGPLLVSDLGRRVNLTSGAATSAVDRLEGRALVERGADRDDRRACRVSLTAQGRKLITKVFAKHKAALDQAAGGLSRGERARLVALLKKLGASADALFETKA